MATTTTHEATTFVVRDYFNERDTSTGFSTIHHYNCDILSTPARTASYNLGSCWYVMDTTYPRFPGTTGSLDQIERNYRARWTVPITINRCTCLDHFTEPFVVIPDGATVEYRGSLDALHGTYRVFEQCECEGCDVEDDERRRLGLYPTTADIRYVLVGNGKRIHHVRRSSIIAA
ncbi:hypothetical protein [Amycolatopsis sp. DSM 110486]|uniref:hypothetical protein n=1 Tax=Amycolatopsis sp. DSM 110486 TaxID=2865832 RepID=UPI001C69F1B9|nr:hypothetical protein [Amycolatopsis sp. DSM 110486]QYN17521.1 hypothetical protein K1T34_32565 [Amycolatopsis sp. DSM 110486]